MSRTDKTAGQLPAASAPPKPSPAPAAPTGIKNTPRGWWCLGGCLAIPLALLLGVSGVGAYFVSKAGLAHIPVFSLAYKEPQPIYAVTPDKNATSLVPADAFKALEGLDQPGADTEAILNDVFRKKNVQAFLANIQKASGSASDRLSFGLTEGMLTATLRQAAISVPKNTEGTQGKEDQPFDLARAQIAISAQQGVELFLPFKNNPQHSALRVYMRPAAVDGALTLSLVDVWIGNLRIPPSLVERLDVEGVQKAFASAAPQMKEHVELTSVTVKDGTVQLEGRFLP